MVWSLHPAVALRVVDPMPRDRALAVRVTHPPPSPDAAGAGMACHDWSTLIAAIAFVSTYPPQRCGIATFTADLAAAVGSQSVVAIQASEAPLPDPAEVRLRIRRDVAADHEHAARWLDHQGLDAVSIQHEYGIWGGPDGALVLTLVEALRTPVVTTLHTVLRSPTPSQRQILVRLVESSAATVVMSTAAADRLARSYHVDPRRVEIIPHGVPDLPWVDPETVKPRLGLEGRMVVLSFGLLGPGKGYESVIAAMPALVRSDPTALFVIVGATHPDLVRRDGEAYRDGLRALAVSLGVEDHVRFVGRFVSEPELETWLMSADVFVTPYPNMEQIVSGTLSYAMGAGKAIVSTPYAYASERLARGRGRLVAAGSTAALAQALIELAADPALRASHGRRAYAYSQGMRWPEVGQAYARLVGRIAAPARSRLPERPVALAGLGRA